ncbi:condensation domain-containing protein [uncultured Methanospirillum sp.]|uniref:condensation domain-containing protein n=1 Tax=uncultured Methanospirillum sp. TaxID=262503 RepID=UPI0029C85789|nr:condensation domain-containing protein [uncultured Methanospirillum sp.]
MSSHKKELTNQNESGNIRKMSLCERMFFMSPVCTVMMAARITGQVDTTRFQKALDAVTGIHPLLRAKIVFDQDHEAFFSTDHVRSIPIRIISRLSDNQWMDEIKREARIPFKLEEGPLIKCILLHSPDVSDLLVLCNHSICDGMALAIFIRDLLELYQDPDKKIEVIHPPDAMNILKPGFSIQGLIGQIFASYTNWKWRKNPYYFGSEEYSTLYSSYWNDKKPGFVLFEFDLTESERLIAICRDHEVSIGSAFSVASLCAYEEICGEFPRSKQKIMMPFDLRRREHVEDVFCLCVGSIHFPFNYSRDKTFWQNAASFHQETHSRLSSKKLPGIQIPPFDLSLMDAIVSYSAFVHRVSRTNTLNENLRKFSEDTHNVAWSLTKNFENSIPCLVPTNLGNIEFSESYGDVKLEQLVFLPSSSELNPLILGGVGARGRVVFSLQFVDPPSGTTTSPESEMIQIRNRALELLGFPEKSHQKPVEEKCQPSMEKDTR